MSDLGSIWKKRQLSRRALVRSTLMAGGGLAAISLVGCGGDDDDDKGASGSDTSGSGGKLDSTKGTIGGKMVIQQFADPGAGLQLVKVKNAGVHQFAGFTHDGLLEYDNGQVGLDPYSLLTKPNLATAMPEQPPDQQTYIYKLRQAKFHTGRLVTSEDVKYSYERYALGADSAYKSDWPWLDHVETPDAQTAVVKTKFPYGDALQSMAARYDAEILAKEWEESPQHDTKLMGTGPFLFGDYSPPTVSHFKRNPDYHRQPYPWFDTVELLGTSDTEKKIADFASRQVYMTYWFQTEDRERIKKARQDANLYLYTNGGAVVYMRNDLAPFKDMRVRQALSMATDRKAVSQVVTSGEGEPDQTLSQTGRFWQFRKPSELGANAKYWNYDVQAAKQLLSAAGLTLPFDIQMPHWNSTVVGQKFVDGIVLIESQWRNAGIAKITDTELTFGQAASTNSVGNYESCYWGYLTLGYAPNVGLALRNIFWSPPEGARPAPTTATPHVFNPALNALIEKQLSQLKKEERIQTFRAIEDIFAEQQYVIATNTDPLSFFGDPGVKNMQTPREAYNGGLPYVKYWWFENGKSPT